MVSLEQDLQKVKQSIDQFGEITHRVLQYLPIVISKSEVKNDYIIHSSQIAGTTKFVRPINKELFLNKPEDFEKNFVQLKEIFEKIKSNMKIDQSEKDCIDRTVYTIQQSIGAGLDLLVAQNSARKHVGNRFEELIKAVFTEIGVVNKKLVLQIPYETDEGSKTYKCENDLILSPHEKVQSTANSLDEFEIVVSVKTTSKDRLGKMFIDKILLERFVDHPQKVIGIFLNDVQRKEDNNISFTLVSGLFMVYTKFLTKLDGIYYLDPPPNASKKPYSDHMKRFSELITTDYKALFSS
ncbi:MAG: hypothetical protein IT274_00180 [Chitinophagales bacterium]|nr:hypothetical protein [Chitinophagales bacterium]